MRQIINTFTRTTPVLCTNILFSDLLFLFIVVVVSMTNISEKKSFACNF